MTKWAGDPMVQDPVALAFDNTGRLYVVETARRSSVDIDIRAHRTWLLEDLANQEISDTRSFFRRRMATELSDENRAWLQDRNQDGIHDWRDLTTISERIRLLEDTDQDGTADHSVVFAEGFQEEFTGVAAGVLPVERDVLFTVYPDLWRLRDHDGDDQADERSVMFRGFGVHAAFDGHDLHGLTVGPEGKIYFSCGDNGFSITTKEGRRLHHPNTGGILRMNPDGSDLEVFATGLRNVQEFDFDRYGNMFGVDNDGDLADERERAVYIAEGSDSGWRLNWQFRAPGWRKFNGQMTYNPWLAEGMWKPQHAAQPAYITPPMQNYSVGPGGFKFNPGTALNSDYQDFFFCIQFPVQKITAFRTRPNGAGFQMADEHVFHSGLMASSVNFGPDGALYIADWVGKWEPNGKGAIYRMDDPAVDGTAVRREVQELLRAGLAAATVPALEGYLSHTDRRIRQMAQFELVRRGERSRLVEIAANGSALQLARIHALWGLIQFGGEHEDLSLAQRLPWSDSDPQIRQQCARVAGELRLGDAVGPLILLLDDGQPLVQSFAATALGKLRAPAATEPLFRLLSQNADRDPFLRHAAVMGLAGCAPLMTLADARTNDSDSVRLGAVLALRRRRADQVSQFLDDECLAVVREAVRAIHDDFSIPAALSSVARLLDQAELPTDEPILRRIISANLRIGTPLAAERLCQFIINPRSVERGVLREELQIEALQCLAVWGNAPLVDRVEGRIRAPSDCDEGLGARLLARDFERILHGASPALAAATMQVAEELKLPVSPALLASWVRSDEQALVTRASALRLLHQAHSELLSDAIDLAWRTKELELRKAALEILVVRDGQAAYRQIAAEWNSASLPQQQLFIATLASLSTTAADKLLSRLLNEQVDGSGPPQLTLDLVAAVETRNDAQQLERLKLWMKNVGDHRWGLHRYALTGGDPKRGEHLYRTHVSAQCMRCHEAGGVGKQAGPELKGIAGRVNREYLLEALVDPNAQIAKGFESAAFVLVDGRTLTGTILEERNDTFVIGTPQAETIEVAKSQIDEQQASQTSAMPSVANVLSPLEVRDLVAYLATLQ